jgi:hypothetical protein
VGSDWIVANYYGCRGLVPTLSAFGYIHPPGKGLGISIGKKQRLPFTHGLYNLLVFIEIPGISTGIHENPGLRIMAQAMAKMKQIELC